MTDKERAVKLYATMKSEISARIAQAHHHNPIKLLDELSAEDKNNILPIAVLCMSRAFERNQTKLISISRAVAREVSKLPFCPSFTLVSAQVRVGVAPLDVMASHGLVYRALQYSKKLDKHKTAHLLVKEDDSLLDDIFELAAEEWMMKLPIGLTPSATPYDNWESHVHKNGTKIVKRGDRQFIADNLRPEHFDLLNTKQQVGWSVNKDMLKVYKQLKRNIKNATLNEGSALYSAFSFHKELEVKSKAGKKLLLNNVISMASNVPDIFYHMYTYDFRGRTYPTTALLHEQGDDAARGLLEFANKQPLGENGYDWVLYNASSHYGEDKLSKQGRISFANDNLSKWISYGDNPIMNKGWMKADNPLQFLRFCLELKQIHEWRSEGNDISKWMTGVMCSIDATTNGAQWLAAVTRDSVLGKHVNLTADKERGDLYQYMADATFKLIEDDTNADDKEARDWWLRLDKKWRRTATKRITMTTYYSARLVGMVQQVQDDLPMEVDRDHSWYFIRKFDVAQQQSAKAPYVVMQRLKKGASDGEAEWFTPLVGFPSKQRYVLPHKGTVNASWLGSRIQINYGDYNHADCKPSIDKHKAGIVANYVHSLDGTHCSLLTDRMTRRGKTMASVHDSYLCMPNDMDILWNEVRDTFRDIASRINEYADIGDGKLNLNDVLVNPHAFS